MIVHLEKLIQNNFYSLSVLFHDEKTRDYYYYFLNIQQAITSQIVFRVQYQKFSSFRLRRVL